MRCDTQNYINVRSKADITQLNLPDGTKLKSGKKKTKKPDMLGNIGKQSGESVESAPKKKCYVLMPGMLLVDICRT